MRKILAQIASRIADLSSSPWAFFVAMLSVLIWTIGGLLFGFSDTYQLIINTGTTIVTFLMVFCVQFTQARDTKAIQAKLDEVISALPQARNELIGIERREEAIS